MPWCTACDRYLSPSTVRTDGACPQCGHTVDAGHARPASTTTDGTEPDPHTSDPEEPMPPVPWHFKLLLAALTIYLGYRAFQGIEWLTQHL